MAHAVSVIILQAAKKRREGAEKGKMSMDEDMDMEDKEPKRMDDGDKEDHNMTLRLLAAKKKKKLARDKREQEE